MATQYRIRVRGQLDPTLSAWFGGLIITHTDDGDTFLTGPVIDQAALYGVLERCRDSGVTLISVNPVSNKQVEETPRESTQGRAK